MHSRFSTNTFPSWPLAHPYRFIAHNGEINTVQGNRNWMRAREAMLASDLLPGLERAFPICTPGASDTARFDEVLELLHLGGRPLPHAMLMMIPEAWENHATMDADAARLLPLPRLADGAVGRPGQRRVHRRHGDRRGARPQRPAPEPLLGHRRRPRRDGQSEVGVLDIDPAKVVRKGRLQPGRMFLIDTARGPHRRRRRDQVDARRASTRTAQWLDEGIVKLADLPDREHVVFSHDSVLRRQQMFGYTHEELKILVAPMAQRRAEPIGSMGTDTPIAVLSERPRLLFDYFQQLFAQVTNPPLDAIREEVVTVGRRRRSGPRPTCSQPGPDELPPAGPAVPDHRQRRAGQDHPHQRRRRRSPGCARTSCTGLYRVAGGGAGAASGRSTRSAREVVAGDRARAPGSSCCRDRNADAVDAPIPSLLLTAAVHHHLVRTKQRTKVGLIVESGDAREVHHMALLIGYGAGAINPYLAFESIEDMIAEDMHGLGGMDPHKAVQATTSRPAARACSR